MWLLSFIHIYQRFKWLQYPLCLLNNECSGTHHLPVQLLPGCLESNTSETQWLQVAVSSCLSWSVWFKKNSWNAHSDLWKNALCNLCGCLSVFCFWEKCTNPKMISLCGDLGYKQPFKWSWRLDTERWKFILFLKSPRFSHPQMWKSIWAIWINHLKYIYLNLNTGRMKWAENSNDCKSDKYCFIGVERKLSGRNT